MLSSGTATKHLLVNLLLIMQRVAEESTRERKVIEPESLIEGLEPPPKKKHQKTSQAALAYEANIIHFVLPKPRATKKASRSNRKRTNSEL
jgi:hypothetical protein